MPRKHLKKPTRPNPWGYITTDFQFTTTQNDFRRFYTNRVVEVPTERQRQIEQEWANMVRRVFGNG
jgi:hypothetical protein